MGRVTSSRIDAGNGNGFRSLNVIAWYLAIVAGYCLLLLPVARAQITSTLAGTVKDAQGAAIVGAEVRASCPSLALERATATDQAGEYRISGLPPGTYTATVRKAGFSGFAASSLELTVNRTFTLNVTLQVAAQATEITVTGTTPLLEPTSSSTGGTITPTQISSMPINGRDYLDLMQLVPGVAINRQDATLRSANRNDPSSDTTTPIMGERSGNTKFLIDGMPNTDQVSGGAASQFNQDSIMEFQVITSGYKAEFGHSSGGVINVVSKSGTNEWHGGGSIFHRNYKLDSSNTSKDTPFLLRWDPTLFLGGPIKKDKVFFFGSAERIRESRELNFQYPTGLPDFIIADQQQYDKHNQTYDLRLRAKLDEQFGHHRLAEQVNWTNTQITDYLPLSQSISTPSQRYNVNARHLILGFSDTATLGDQTNPFILDAFFQYRGEPSLTLAAHPAAGIANTRFNMFFVPSPGQTDPLFGDQPVTLGYGSTPTLLDQKHWSAGVSMSKQLGRQSIKFGWDFQHMIVDGTESAFIYNQLFATVPDYQTYGINDAGVYLLQAPAATTAQDSQIRLRNDYNGFYFEDDIKVFKTLTFNAGLRWDYDSRFPTNGELSPRIGLAWAATPKTVIRGNWGYFYDHFRLGLARDIPAFGGANLQQVTYFSLPRLFYGNPSVLLAEFAYIGYGTPCATQNAALGAVFCGANLLPVGALNSVVATGHAPISAGAVVNYSNVQTLTGMSAQQFADAASVAIGKSAGYFTWDPLGHLGTPGVIKAYNLPITLDPGFKVPYTASIQVGIQRELTPTLVVSADYYRRSMRDVLGVRQTNIAFDARLKNNRALVPGTGTVPIEGFGPWYAGMYNGLVFSLRKTMSQHFALQASYTWTDAWDDVVSYTGTGTSYPSDAFVGVVPVVTDPASATGPCAHPSAALSNASASFTAANCNPVPQAGQFYNGPMYDKGPSALALKHTFLIDGIVQLPWKSEFSSIFRVQSGFPYSRNLNTLIDVDGNTNSNGIDHSAGRNDFTAPTFANVDMRVAKRFDISERVRLHAYFEMFNLLNAANPAAVQTQTNVTSQPFGSKTQLLPGREGQVGLRIEF